jgi:hypothetical protein
MLRAAAISATMSCCGLGGDVVDDGVEIEQGGHVGYHCSAKLHRQEESARTHNGALVLFQLVIEYHSLADYRVSPIGGRGCSRFVLLA